MPLPVFCFLSLFEPVVGFCSSFLSKILDQNEAIPLLPQRRKQLPSPLLSRPYQLPLLSTTDIYFPPYILLCSHLSTLTVSAAPCVGLWPCYPESYRIVSHRFASPFYTALLSSIFAMPIRNPFARRPGPLATANDSTLTDQERSHSGFERVDTVGSKASSALSIRSARSQDTGEYKMSGMSLCKPRMCRPCPRPSRRTKPASRLTCSFCTFSRQ